MDLVTILFLAALVVAIIAVVTERSLAAVAVVLLITSELAKKL